ncbi:hypothetical protein BDZ45DRAFT_623027 [Acephala macrosclerotiorum]|nr:hypothetical protein BDZ45DRAFT_623027 [Acephala macrosclerotiorum]
MSQISSQALDPDWVSLSILKFSHNTSPYGTKTYTWSHISTRPDLDIVIRNTRCVDEQGKYETRVIMKVGAGADVMETQDLLELVRFCQQFDPSTGAEHPVEVAIKSPFLAMRYPKTVNTVRRLQIKFRSHEDFQKVHYVLKDLGLPITSKETTAPPNPQPIPSPAPSIAASTASSSTLIRPSSAVYNAGPTNSPLKSDFKLPPRPDSTTSEDRTRVNDTPFRGNSIPRPTSIASIGRVQPNDLPLQGHSSTRPEPITSIDRAHTSDPLFSRTLHPAIIAHPTLSRVNSFQNSTVRSPASYPPQPERESRHFSHPTSQVSDYPKPIPDIYPRTSLYIDQLQIQRQESAKSLESQALSTSRFFPSSVIPSTGDQEVPNPSFAWDQWNAQRPASTPAASTTVSTLILPPKRVLPFPRLEESDKPRKSSLSDLPQISKTTPAIIPTSVSHVNSGAKELSTPASKPAPKKRVAQRKAPAAKSAEDTSNKGKPSFEEIVIAEPQPVAEDPSPLAAKSSAAMVARPASTPLGLVSKAAPPTKKRAATPAIRPKSSNKRPKMVDQTTQTQDLPAQQGKDTQKQASNPAVSTPSISSSSTSSPPDDYLEAVDAFVAKHKARPPPTELWETPSWADADDEYRARLINHFICNNLENSDFLKLCEDMGTAWRKIGLGF